MSEVVRRWPVAGLLVLVCLSGCDEMQFGFAPGARFTPLTVQPDTGAAYCMDELATADVRVHPSPPIFAERAAALGAMSERAYRQQERRRQRDWDQYYCRREAECLTMANPGTAMADIGDHLEVCLRDRAQRRVAMAL